MQVVSLLRFASFIALVAFGTAARATDYYASSSPTSSSPCTDPQAPCDLGTVMALATGTDIRIHIAASAGVYTPQYINGTKSMTLIGAGSASTLIGPGSSVPSCAITITTANVVLEDLGLAPAPGCCGRGVCMNVPDGAAASVTLNRVVAATGQGSRGIEATTTGTGSASISVVDSRFQGDGDGGIVLGGKGNVHVDRTLFVGNWGNSTTTAPLQVSGSATTLVTNSTFTANYVDAGVGGVSHASSGLLTLINVTLAGNSGTAISANVASIDHSIVEGTCAIGGVLGDAGYSVESPGHTCKLSGSTSYVDVTAQELALGALADNGGFTPTLMPQPNSVAVAIGGPGCEPVDQRNFARTDPCDAGAVQANADVIFRSSFE